MAFFKRQSLFASAEWITSRISTSDSEFLIRKKPKYDYIYLLFDKRFFVFEINTNYIIRAVKPSSRIVLELTNILAKLFSSKEVYQVKTSK